MSTVIGKKPRKVLGVVDQLQNTIGRQMDIIRSYKMRQDAIVMDLGHIRQALEDGYSARAKDLLDDLLAVNLKQAKDRVDNHMLALKVAVDALESGVSTKISRDALSQIELIAPKEFLAVQSDVVKS